MKQLMLCTIWIVGAQQMKKARLSVPFFDTD
jgi:hypothetical protein